LGDRELDYQTKTLVIAPHIDDEALGCAAVLTSDTFVFYVGVDEFHIVDRQTRLAEAQAVADHFGFQWEIGDFRVNRYYEEHFRLLQVMEGLINKLRPKTILIPMNSYNQDHRTAHQACFTALRQHDRNFFVPRVLIYEEPDCFLWEVEQFKPNYYLPVDIERKLAGYSLHKSQVRPFRSHDTLQSMAALRGAQCNMPFAEAFQILRWVDSQVP
jgi:LmbE family N-acetylglucosaminyl deacetylase